MPPLALRKAQCDDCRGFLATDEHRQTQIEGSRNNRCSSVASDSMWVGSIASIAEKAYNVASGARVEKQDEVRRSVLRKSCFVETKDSYEGGAVQVLS